MANQKTLTLMDDIRLAAPKLKGGALKRLNLIQGALKRISADLNLKNEQQAIAFVAIFDRQCGNRNTDIDDLSNYLEISSLDAMQFLPEINYMFSEGYLTVENNSENLLTRKQFMVCPDVFYAIIENRKVEPVKMLQKPTFDQFDFCVKVHELIDERSRDVFDTRKLFFCVENLEKEHHDLELVAQLRACVSDIESRTLFYEMCKDYAERPDGTGETLINRTLEDIYDRVLSRTNVKKTILNQSNPLITADLIRQREEDEMRLTPKGVKLLFGDNADTVLRSNIVKDRYEFVSRIYDLVDDMRRNPTNVDIRGLYFDIRQMEDDNASLSMVQRVKAHIDEVKSRLIFYLTANEMVDGCTYSISSISEFCGRSEEVRLKQRLKSGDHPLIRRNLVEVRGGNMFDGAQLALTDKGKELFLEEDLSMFETRIESKELIKPEEIVTKQLFFDPQLQNQLAMLSNSLTQENYTNLTQRLVDNNLAKGVAVLLYGNPGTGKTEFVKQIARQTGRAIMHVDISATKTCWFGESEKLIKEVFTKYRQLCQKSNIKPILLFNEADAVFSKRKDTTMSSVAQTENAIQNIILEEIENLDGILIATTNLADNLDKAFERRFLFKIRFDAPTVEARCSIWRDKLSSLTPEEAQMLGSRYDFSGGEIDNITRKVIMSEVIEGTRPSIETICGFCDQEKISSKSTKVGF